MGKGRRNRAAPASGAPPSPASTAQLGSAASAASGGSADSTGASPAAPAAWSRHPLVAPLGVFVALLALYVATLAPTVVGGDSGELAAAAAVAGVPHPPGYPLFAMLGRLFAALPLGPSIAWRVNLVSAFATAGAAALLFATARAWTGSAIAGLLAAALFGCDPLVWHHATAAEVFGLNAFFVAATLRLWLRLEQLPAPRARDVYGLALVAGLAMTNHHTYVFIGAPVIVRALWSSRHMLGARGIVTALAAGLAGLLPYLYLPLASASNAAVSWGNQTTLPGFLRHLLRQEYGTISLGHAGTDAKSAFQASGTFFPTLYQLFGGMVRRLAGIGLPLAIVGLALATRDRAPQIRTRARILAGLILFYTLTFTAMSNLSTKEPLYVTVLSRFFIQADALVALAAALGLAALARRIGARAAKLWLPGAAGVAIAASVTAAAVMHPQLINQSGNTVFREFVTRAFNALPRRAIVVTMGDHVTGAIMYLHGAEKLRPDVVHLDRELLGFPWYAPRVQKVHPDLVVPKGLYFPDGWNISQLIAANPSRPVFVIDRLKEWDQSWKKAHKLAVLGLTFWLAPSAQAPRYEDWVQQTAGLMEGFDPLPALGYPLGTWEREVGVLALQMQVHRAHQALIYSHDAGKTDPPARFAIGELEGAIKLAGGSPALGLPSATGITAFEIHHLVWKDLGMANEVLATRKPEYMARAVAAFDLYLPKAPADDQDVAQIRAYVANYRAAAKAR